LLNFLTEPQIPIWLLMGFIAGAIFGFSQYRSPANLIWITGFVILPVPLWAVVYSITGVNTIMLGFTLLLFMFGLVGFPIGWVPGVLVGAVFGYMRIDKP
jgi:hypothetical protein